MKASKFTDAQKVFIVKQGEEGTPVSEICRKAGIRWPIGECEAIAGRQPGDLFQLEEKVCRPAAERNEAAQAARRRERTAEEDRGRPDAGPGNVAGRHPPKDLRPGRMCELVRGMCSDWEVSIRTTHGAIGFDPSAFH